MPATGVTTDRGRVPTVSSGLAERLAARRRRNRNRLLVALSIPVLLVGLAATAWFSPVLALEDVTVDGSELVDPHTVAGEVLDGHRGTPLPRIRTGEVEAQILENHPELASAAVSWSGPRQLHVTAVDRVPVMALKDGGTIALVDAEAVVVTTAADYPQDLPRLELSGEVGEAERADVVAAALQLLSPLSDDERGTVTVLRADHPERLTGVLRIEDKDVTVVFGDGSQATEKFRLAHQLAATGASEIDVSVPHVPVTG